MKNRILSLILAFIFCLCAFSACSSENKPSDVTIDTTANSDVKEPAEAIIYVDSSAADSGDGSENAPFKAIAEAQAKIREMKADGLPDGGVTVLLADGNYHPIAFTEEDSGSESAPIVYKADGATITGGVTLSSDDFEPLTDDEKAKLIDDDAKEAVLKVDLSKYGITKEDLGSTFNDSYSSVGYNYETGEVNGFAELFINTDRMTLARYPNDSFIKTGETDGTLTFAFKDEVKERALNWDTDTLSVSGYFCFDWSFQTMTADIDIESLNVTLGNEINYGIAKNRRYFFLNVFAETDVAGEYYIDRKNAILYVYPTEDFDTADIVLSVSDKDLITVDNASYLTFDGLNVSASRANGIKIGGSNITIENCNISDVRGNAVTANGTYITVKNNEIYNIGDHAVIISGGDAPTLTSSGNLIHNNYIHNWAQNGRTYYCAARISGCGTVVSHNEMHDAPHEAIQYNGPNHIIEYNKIYNVCTETDDCGAIYAYRSFLDYGSTIRYNFIHDIGGSLNMRADGIFWDDAESGQTAYGNVIVNVTGHGINVGGGRDNVIENNLIIDWNYKNRFSILYDDRGQMFMDNDKEQSARMGAEVKAMQQHQEWLDAFPGYGDIIPFTVDYDGDLKDPMLSGNPANSIVRNNMYYKMKKTAYAGENDPDHKYDNIIFSDFFKVFENNITIKDYEYVDIPGYENGDYTLAENSKAYQNGFEKLPFDQMGRIIEE